MIRCCTSSSAAEKKERNRIMNLSYNIVGSIGVIRFQNFQCVYKKISVIVFVRGGINAIVHCSGSKQEHLGQTPLMHTEIFYTMIVWISTSEDISTLKLLMFEGIDHGGIKDG